MRHGLLLILLFLFINGIAQQPVDSAVTVPGIEKEALVKKKQTVWRWVIPGALIGLGTWGSLDSRLINRFEIKEERDQHLPGFNVHADNYAQFVPAAAVYVLGAFGNKPKHDAINHSVILLKSELIMNVIIIPLKNMTNVMRPDSTSRKSFPSGHTAQAFLAANFLRHEYGHKSIWYSIAGYSLATGVGLFRLANNRHWLSDVLAGAGIGLLSSELAYATHKYKWNRKKQISVVPLLNHSGGGIYLAMQL